MPRRPSSDPKVPVALSLRTSTRDAIVGRLQATGDSRSVGRVLSEAVEAKYGVGEPPQPSIQRPAGGKAHSEAATGPAEQRAEVSTHFKGTKDGRT